MKKLINCDCLEWLKKSNTRCKMIFADPPDGINLKYNGFDDTITSEEYEYMLYRILIDGCKKADVIWLSLNTKYTAMAGHITWEFLNFEPSFEFKPCIQTFTFGQNNKRDLTNCHRLLWRYKAMHSRLYPDAIRIPSWRQLNGDKRANPGGKTPSDVFDFPRVTGNSKQRRKFSPTQLHEGLYERCIKLCCKPGDTVVDLFAGSGTLGRVADTCKVDAIMVEYSRETCDNILADQPDVEEIFDKRS